MWVLADQGGSGDVRDVSWWLNSLAHKLNLSPDTLWTIVVALNLAALVWFLRKALFKGKGWSIPSSLKSRGDGIRASIADADRSYKEAAARLAEIEKRIADLPAELARIEQESAREAEMLYERNLEEHRREAERIAQAARKEIEAATTLAQKELRRYAAVLAMDLAEQSVRERMTPELDRAIVREATRSLN